jgi:hypothetical protein
MRIRVPAMLNLLFSLRIVRQRLNGDDIKLEHGKMTNHDDMNATHRAEFSEEKRALPGHKEPGICCGHRFVNQQHLLYGQD